MLLLNFEITFNFSLNSIDDQQASPLNYVSCLQCEFISYTPKKTLHSMAFSNL